MNTAKSNRTNQGAEYKTKIQHSSPTSTGQKHYNIGTLNDVINVALHD